MGKVFGGSFANIFMAKWESSCLASFQVRPKLWKRFQDDIIGVWSVDENFLLDFHKHANNLHQNIHSTLSYGASVNFLDMTIYKLGNRLLYKPYFKPTDSHLLLPPHSHHPRLCSKQSFTAKYSGSQLAALPERTVFKLSTLRRQLGRLKVTRTPKFAMLSIRFSLSQASFFDGTVGCLSAMFPVRSAPLSIVEPA